MASSNFFLEYNEYLNELKNTIMQLHLKFRNCKSALEMDHNNGVITDEEYAVYKDLSITDYFKGANPKYTLTLEEVDFLNQYADFDLHGDLYLTLVKKEYFQKQDLLRIIFESIRKFNYFDMVSFDERKHAFANIVRKENENDVKEFQRRAQQIKDLYGRAFANTAEYKEFIRDLEERKKTNVTMDEIRFANPEQLNHLICRFYGIDYSYYRWYKDMALKDEFDRGTVFYDQALIARNVVGDTDTLVELSSAIRELNKNLESYTNQLSMFLVTFGDFKYVPEEAQEEKKSGFFGKKRKVSLNNREELFKIFSLLVGIGSVSMYADTLKDNEKDTLEMMFKAYMDKVYGKEVDYVDLDSFRQNFMKEVVTFYKTKIQEVGILINKKSKQVSGLGIGISDGVKKMKEQATVAGEIRDRFSLIGTIPALEGFSVLDSRKIYDSMREYLSGDNEVKTMVEGVINKKVK